MGIDSFHTPTFVLQMMMLDNTAYPQTDLVWSLTAVTLIGPVTMDRYRFVQLQTAVV